LLTYSAQHKRWVAGKYVENGFSWDVGSSEVVQGTV